jgi:hypothetical protein
VQGRARVVAGARDVNTNRRFALSTMHSNALLKIAACEGEVKQLTILQA